MHCASSAETLEDCKGFCNRDVPGPIVIRASKKIERETERRGERKKKNISSPFDEVRKRKEILEKSTVIIFKRNWSPSFGIRRRTFLE